MKTPGASQQLRTPASPPGAGDRGPVPARAPRTLPRLTRRVMWDLAVWMVSLGLLIGIVFPPFTVLLGIPASQAFRWAFVAACLVAGALVGVANHALARAVVGGRLRLLGDRLRVVDDALREATLTGNWSACNPDLCRLEVDSRDEIGESAAAFNRLVEALGRSHEVEEAMRTFADTLAEHLEVEALTAHALEHVLVRTVFDAGAVLATDGGELVVASTQGIQHAELLADSVAVRTALVEDRTLTVDAPDDVVVDGVVVDFRPRLVYVAPISFRGAEMGVLILAANRDVAPETEHLIEMFRRSLGVALKNALVHDDLQRLAALDPLAGLYNRRFGLERLAEEYAHAGAV